MKPVIFYHHPCLDGFAAMYAAFSAFGDQAEYVPAAPGFPMPRSVWELQGKTVFVLDMMFECGTMWKLVEECENVFLFDHHRSNFKRVYPHRDLANFHVFYSARKSGCRLAWEHFMGNEMIPTAFRYIEDSDLKRYEFSETRDLIPAFRSLPFELEAWAPYWHNPEELLPQGRTIRAYLDKQVEWVLRDVWTKKLEGNDVAFVNAPWMIAGDVAERLAEDYPIAMAYWDSGDLTHVSVRTDGKIDASQFAESYGGGGHRWSAAFRIPRGQIEHLETFPKYTSMAGGVGVHSVLTFDYRKEQEGYTP